jgi:uncharacterized protein with HEPN domain
VLCWLLVIGEAAARITPETEARFEEIPFRKQLGAFFSTEGEAQR